MTLEGFKEVYGGKSPLEMLRLLAQQYGNRQSDAVDMKDASWRGNTEEAEYWGREAEAMQARIDWLTGNIVGVLGEHEPKVLTLAEVLEWDGALYIECRPSSDPKAECAVLSTVWLFSREDYTLYDGVRLINNCGGTVTFEKSSYGKTTRCWNKRPTNAQREAEPWEQ